jgi:hypothetical protein
MKLSGFRILLSVTLISLSSALTARGFNFIKEKLQAQDTISFVSPFQADNDRCFKCHGQEKYEYTNENLGLHVKALMCTNQIMKRDDFYRSNHKNLSCTDCHSVAYVTFPHPGILRMEQKFDCIDCHGGDKKFAQFHFEEIESEYQQSAHFKLEADGFTCWKCHDPHSYRISIRNSKNLIETILYDNTICLNCHSDFSRFQLLYDHEEINILKKHDWLPNQSSHFRSVRCIECHTKINESILVSHLIQPKEAAVKHCNECHSKNSMLMTTLYKFRSKELRRDGFFNGVILNESYVIGANRNEYLNILSIAIFAIVIAIIGIHIFLRVIRKSK